MDLLDSLMIRSISGSGQTRIFLRDRRSTAKRELLWIWVEDHLIANVVYQRWAQTVASGVVIIQSANVREGLEAYGASGVVDSR